MAYIGGKAKCYSHIIEILNNEMFDKMDYLEPFVGYCHILKRIRNKNRYLISDVNPLLITLLKYIQKNTNYPIITKQEYENLKKSTSNDTATMISKSFAAFCYSYNGKEFGGYTLHDKSGKRDYPEERKRYYKFLYSNEPFSKSKIYLKNYYEYEPENMLIYCDPPYNNTTKYGNIKFDSEKFWEIMRKWSKKNYVYISEYNAPKDFIMISNNNKWSSLAGKGSNTKRIENLFTYKEGLGIKILKI